MLNASGIVAREHSLRCRVQYQLITNEALYITMKWYICVVALLWAN